MPPGIIHVSSRIAHLRVPRADVALLEPRAFCAWYEERHIGEVVRLPGVSGAGRWEAESEVQSKSDEGEGKKWSDEAPWLTVYEMPDVEYRLTTEFRSLDGQSAPSPCLLHSVFEQARFDTRFYALRSSTAARSDAPPRPASFLLSWASDAAAEVDVEAVKDAIDGCVSVRSFEVVDASTLENFVRRDARVKRGLVLVEFERGVERGRVREVLERGSEEVEVGWYALKRVYGSAGGRWGRMDGRGWGRFWGGW